MKRRHLILPSIVLAVVVYVGINLVLRAANGRSGDDSREATAEAACRNVLLIVLDTVRADRLGCYGNQRGLTPRIDAFATSGVRFSNAFSHSPWTLPSTASLFTSLYPMQHRAGGRLGSFTRLPSDAVTIAEAFRDAGTRTAAIFNVQFLTETYGMTQGFEHVDVHALDSNVDVRRAAETTDAAAEWLETREEGPFFLVVHYFDAHLVYDPPQPFRARFADPQDAETEDWLFGSIRDMALLRQANSVFPPPELVRRLESLYDGETAYVDHHVGRLLDILDARGLSTNTLVAITADHGEEFLDHGGFEHGHTFYDEQLHVPLIVRLPQLPADRRGATVDTTARLIDVAPTLLAAAGIPVDPGFEGESLLGLLLGEEDEDRPVMSQGPLWGLPGDALRVNGHKLIRRVAKDGRVRLDLFDLKTDKAEKNNLAREEPELRNQLLRRLLDMEKELAEDSLQSEATELTPKDVDRLRSLGYTG